MKLKILLIIISLLPFLVVIAQTDSLVKAIYIDNFFEADSSDYILGDSLKEQQLFDYAENCGYNYLILYGLSAVPLGSDTNAVNALRNFVRRAHEEYHIKLGCVGQSSKFFGRIHNKYQSLAIVDSVERLDSYNLEFEFWKSYHAGIYEGYYCEYYLEPNGYSCDSIGAFEFAMDELDKIDSIASLLLDTLLFEENSNVSTEIYIGWINSYHAEVLVEKVEQGKLDKILGAVYKPALEDGSLNLYYFPHQIERMEFLGSPRKKIDFLPIFAVKEKQGNHLGDWMDTIGSIPYVWEHYSSEFLKDTSAYTDSINLNGYVWFNYSNMPLCFDSLGNNAWLNAPEGRLFQDSVYSFQILDAEHADRYYWEIPQGVVFADSAKWESDVFLKFSSSFNKEDSIMVRPANRCHLGETHYYSVDEMEAIPIVSKEIQHVYSKNGEIHFTLLNEKHQQVNYQIFNMQGQLLQRGGVNKNRISFNNKRGYYMIRFDINGKFESYVFRAE